MSLRHPCVIFGGILVGALCASLLAGAALASKVEYAVAHGGVLAVTTGDFGDLYLINGDGAGRRRLTSTPETESCPSWSPDGRRLAYAVQAVKKVANGILPGPRSLDVINADGSGRRTLA